MRTMDAKTNLLNCRVCGLEQPEPPWGEDGNTPSFNICPCCGVEFGYEDSTLITIRRYRDLWLENGAKWSVPKATPLKWNIEEQLRHIPQEYV